MEIGAAVVFSDEFSVEHDALITAIHGEYGPESKPSINLCYVSKDSARSDTYGRQIMRNSSVPHRSNQSARGMFWREVHGHTS